MSKTEKAILIYLVAGVAVRLSGRCISNSANTETFVGSVVLWPAVLLNGFSGVPWRPSAAPTTSTASSDGAAVNPSLNA